jgi:hypothetical protein
MQTVGITIEDASFAELNAVSQAAGLTPAEFVRRAAAAAVRLHKARDAAQRDIAGYAALPVTDDEFAIDPADLTQAADETW